MGKRLLELALLAAFAVGVYHARRAWLEGGGARAPKAARAAQAAPAPVAPAEPPKAPETPKLALPRVAAFKPEEAALMQQIHARFATGDFVGALKLADEKSAEEGLSDAFHGWLLEQLPALLTSAGWARLKLGDCDEATTYLRRSEALRRSVETAKGLAVCYYKQRNLAGAREQFTWFNEKSPGDLQMLVLFADVQESEGRYDDAVKTLEQVVEGMTNDKAADPKQLEAVKQRLASMRGRAKESGFQQTEVSRNFRLAYRAGDHEDLVSFVLATLEEALDEYVESFGLRPPQAPIEVILYPAGDFKSVMVGGPEWAEGLFDGRVRIPVKPEMLQTGRFDGLQIVLRHELVHALLALMSDARAVPPWFDEGLAQRLSCAKAPCGRFAFPATPGAFLPTPAFQSSYISFDALKAGRAYRQSHYLILTLERLYGDDSLRQVVSRITTSSNLDSDGLLEPLGSSFKTLHTAASTRWDKREVP